MPKKPVVAPSPGTVEAHLAVHFNRSSTPTQIANPIKRFQPTMARLLWIASRGRRSLVGPSFVLARRQLVFQSCTVSFLMIQGVEVKESFPPLKSSSQSLIERGGKVDPLAGKRK